MTTRRYVLIALVAAAGLPRAAVMAQPTGRPRRIGFLASSAPPKQLLEAFRDGMRQHGYEEGKNLAIEVRWNDESSERLAELAAELIRSKADVILSWGTPATLAAKKGAGATIPIVFVGAGDPVGSGIVGSLSRPGGNVTGISNLSADLSAKLVEMLIQIVPSASRVGVLRNPTNPTSALLLKESEGAARRLGLKLEVTDISAARDIPIAFATLTKARVTAVVILPDPHFIAERRRLADLAIQSRLPTAFAREENVEAGGLVSYGPSLLQQTRHAAGYVDRILKGAKPADLPVELPTTLGLTVNMKTAKALGVSIPQSILVRADRVIE